MASNKAPEPSHWIEHACQLFDDHAKSEGWKRHIYSDNLRALLVETTTLQARIAKLEAATSRADTLLKVAYTMLKEGDGTFNEILVKYDDAECDWMCLCDDIESWIESNDALQKGGE